VLGRRATEQGISSPTDAAHHFALQAAVLGAKVLNWPREPLPVSPDAAFGARKPATPSG